MSCHGDRIRKKKSPFYISRLMIFTLHKMSGFPEVPSDGPTVYGSEILETHQLRLVVCSKVLGPSQVVQDFFHQEYQVEINGYRKWVISLVKYSKNSDLFIVSHYTQWDALGGSVK